MLRPEGAGKPRCGCRVSRTEVRPPSSILWGLGRSEETLPVVEEAVSLSRELAAANPETFTPDLAMSLGTLCRPGQGGRSLGFGPGGEYGGNRAPKWVEILRIDITWGTRVPSFILDHDPHRVPNLSPTSASGYGGDGAIGPLTWAFVCGPPGSRTLPAGLKVGKLRVNQYGASPAITAVTWDLAVPCAVRLVLICPAQSR
jgi:hypothetical protein